MFTSSGEIWWMMFIPLAVILLSLMGVVVWSEFSGTSFTTFFKTISNPEKLGEEIFVPVSVDVNPSMNENGLNTDPVSAQLDNDAHRDALEKWCSSKNWSYDHNTNRCLAPTEELCRNKSTDFVDFDHLDVQNKPFLIWSNGKCIRTFGNVNTCTIMQQNKCIESKRQSQCQDFCKPSFNTPEQAKIAYNSSECKSCLQKAICKKECEAGEHSKSCIDCVTSEGCSPVELPYVNADVTCDENGLCTAPDQPTCTLTKSYCQNKGADYSNVKNGDCHIGSFQKDTEMIFGKTITRKYKKNIQNLINSCKADGPFSSKCLKSLAVYESTAAEIVIDSSWALFTEDVQNFKDTCTNGKIVDAKTTLMCIRSTADFFPEFWLLDKGTDFANNMLMLIPGMPNLKQQALQALYDYGAGTLQVIYNFGFFSGRSGVSWR